MFPYLNLLNVCVRYLESIFNIQMNTEGLFRFQDVFNKTLNLSITFSASVVSVKWGRCPLHVLPDLN